MWSMSCLLQTLHHWQDLIGASIAGFLGVVGALVVAQSALNRERRNASRMLNRDLYGAVQMVNRPTDRGEGAASSIDPDTLGESLAYSCYQLSPLFETQMAVVIAIDATMAAFLVRFREALSEVENAARIYREANGGVTPDTLRAREVLPFALERARNYAVITLRLIRPFEVGVVRRTLIRLQQSLFPTEQDKQLKKQIERYLNEE